MPSTSTRIITAFLYGQKRRNRNDVTDGTRLFFHSSCIAEHLPNGQIRLSHCGHAKPSTIARLNMICELAGCGRPWRIRNFAVQFDQRDANDSEIINAHFLHQIS